MHTKMNDGLSFFVIPRLRQVIFLLSKSQSLSIDVKSFLILAINILRLTKTFTSKYIDRYFQNVTIKPYKELFSILCYVNTRSLNDIIVSVSLIMRIIVLNEFRLHRLSGVSSMSRSRWGCRWFHLDLFQCQSHVHVEFLFV